ncbi:MAG: type II toxin-antitoxin system HicB family antitoxin [Planctomycetota bacterium]
MNGKYSIWIRWSEEDGVFVAYLPEFKCTGGHGATYDEALRSAKECLETLTHPVSLAEHTPAAIDHHDDIEIKINETAHVPS